jgi:DNA-binding transcriptional LysR family regulator
MAFTGEPGLQEGLEQVSLVEDELIVAASPEMKVPASEQADTTLPEIALHDCADLPFLLREPGSATRMVFEKALKRQSKNIDLDIIGYLESQEAIKEATKAGLGITVISQKAVEDELKAGLLKGYRLKGIPIKRNFYLVFRKQSIFPPLDKAFFQFAREYFHR